MGLPMRDHSLVRQAQKRIRALGSVFKADRKAEDMHAPGPEDGQGLMELAIVLPILMLLLVGMVETVALANSYLRLQTTVREGARFGSHATVPATANGAAQIRELIRSQMEAGGLAVSDPEQDIVVVFASLDPKGQGRITRVQYPKDSASCPTDLSADEFLARAKAGEGPASADLVAVEVCLQHSQLLGLPIVSDLLPDPMPIHLSTVMPRTWP